jgi:hypothetical protein
MVPTLGDSLVVREAFFMDIWTLEDETTALHRNVGY